VNGFRALVGVALIAMAGCASRPERDTTPNADSGPVDLALVSAEGRRFALRELRGKPALLFIFTTFDDASQLALTLLTRFLGTHRELHALGIAAQPDPAQLLPLYRDALAVSFPLAYEQQPQIASGESALGPIAAVPAYVLLDADGRVTARHSGALSEQQLEDLVTAHE